MPTTPALGVFSRLDFSRLPATSLSPDNNEVGCAVRGAQAEELVMNWATRCGINVEIPKSRQKGYDVILDGVKTQVKQRTTKKASGGGYVIDGLRLNLFRDGFVEAFMVIETLAPTHAINRILTADAKDVFGHPGIYFSEYNQRSQLSAKKFESIAQILRL